MKIQKTDPHIFRELYLDLKSKALKSFQVGNLERSLDYIVVASTFAWWYHFGIWFDDELESLLKNIASKILSVDRLKKISKSKRKKANRILFITTFLTDTGGHTEALKLWIKCLSKEFNELYIVSTEILNRTVGYDSVNFIKNYANLYFFSYREKYTEKIMKLAKIILDIRPSHIILFIDPNDVVTVSTLSILKNFLKFKVIFFNHADHVFWLGKNIIDILVEFRSYSVYVSRKLRKFRKDIVIIPLTTDIYMRNDQCSDDTVKSIDKRNIVTSLSIGASWKIIDEGYWNYFEVIKEILEQNPNHVHILITEPSSYVKNRLNLFPRKVKERIKLIPGTSDPLPYYKCADFLIETFPVIGGTVRVEAMALGLPVVFIENSHSKLLSVTDVIPKDYPFIARSNEEVVRYSNELIRNQFLRNNLSEYLRTVFFDAFSYEVVCDYIKKLFLNLNNNIDFSNNIDNKIEEFDVQEDINYLLSLDFSCRKFKDPYLIMLKLILTKSCNDINLYYQVFKNLDLIDLYKLFKKTEIKKIKKIFNIF